MEFLVSVGSGVEEGRTVIISPGKAVKFGRDDPADELFPTDSNMSRSHFEVEAGQSGCILRDLGSSNGTFVGDRRISQIELTVGSRFRAGETEFVLLQSDERNPNRDAPAKPTDSRLPQITLVDPYISILKHLVSPSKEFLYAILDAAQNGLILALLSQSDEEHRTLYEGKQGEELSAVGPFLVKISPNSRLLPILIQLGWKRNWAVYLTSTLEFAAIRRHLRRFLLVQDECSQRLYFRFYDPRVMRAFLVTCTPEEKRDFFGPVSAFLLESETGALVRFTITEQSETTFNTPR